MFQINLQGKTAWVLGGSRGVGRAIAQSLSDAGCKVALSYFREEGAATSFAEQLNQATPLERKVIALHTDVRDSQSCAAAHAQIVDQLGPADILINAAGIIDDDLFLMLDSDRYQNIFAVNFFGALNTTRLVLPEMMNRRWGRVINISSTAATRPGRGQSNYAASKAALEAWSKSLACEVGKKGVTVNCIAPGVIATDMSKPIVSLAHEEIMQRQIIKRLGKPEEIAACALYLASQQSDYVTGEVMTVSGGLKLL